jgi:hypothetical protein
MPSGYVVGVTDLDSIFAPLHPGWPQASAVGYAVAGSDLNSRYAPLSTGGAAAATGYKDGPTDLNAIFAALGSTNVQVGVQPSNVSGIAAAGRPSGTVTSAAASCAGAKGSGTYTYAWHTTGCTANSPISQSTTFSATVGAASTDNASAFCTISDGVTLINTITISVTLQNTSPAALSVTASPANVSAHTLNPAQLTTPVTTATVTSSGVAPFTFRWSFASGGAGITITNPNGASTAFTAFVSSGDDFEGDAVCTVTDSVGTVGVSNGVFVILNSTA